MRHEPVFLRVFIGVASDVVAGGTRRELRVDEVASGVVLHWTVAVIHFAQTIGALGHR